jgi:peptide deformylase
MSLYFLQSPKSEFLRRPCVKVDDFSNLDELLRTMSFTMHLHNRESITAPQLGEPYQLILAKVNDAEKILINPRIVEKKGYCISLEKCVNLSGIPLPKVRRKEIVLEYQGKDGAYQRESFSGQPALYIQHSMDHLRGKLLFHYF